MKHLVLALLLLGITALGALAGLDYSTLPGRYGVSCWYRPYQPECVTYDTQSGAQVGPIWYPTEKHR